MLTNLSTWTSYISPTNTHISIINTSLRTLYNVWFSLAVEVVSESFRDEIKSVCIYFKSGWHYQAPNDGDEQEQKSKHFISFFFFSNWTSKAEMCFSTFKNEDKTQQKYIIHRKIEWLVWDFLVFFLLFKNTLMSSPPAAPSLRRWQFSAVARTYKKKQDFYIIFNFALKNPHVTYEIILWKWWILVNTLE